MLADIESFFHRLRRRFDRSERAIRKFGLPVFENSGEKPGLLLIQIDSLSYKELSLALENKLAPFLERLKEREKYRLHRFGSEGAPLAAILTELCQDVDGSVPSPQPRLGMPYDAAKVDLVRGLPVVHLSLPRSGARALAGIDSALRSFTVEAHRSQRRDYHVWIFSAETGDPAEHGFLLIPPDARLPSVGGSAVQPEELRSAAMAQLGHHPNRNTLPAMPTDRERISIMSYNVHSCTGMDGRVSPRRIARVISRQDVDIVALQEIDHGRVRSRSEDQAGDIAAELGFHLLFCPAVIRGDERYGHALLSRWPLEEVKIAALPVLPGGIWPEARAALWARIHGPDFRINVLSTHLGLSAPERMKQMAAILGPEWLGPVLDKEPVILCGDFNLTPGSPAHRLAASRLRDVAHNFKRGVRTFSSMRLVAQLDHIFVSPHFGLETVFAAQNDLTRVASDHLPLVAHLRRSGS